MESPCSTASSPTGSRGDRLRVDFYHLTENPLERVLPMVAEKVLDGGGRLLVVAGQPLLGRLDELLWAYAPDSFLPHALATEPRAADQPVLLSETLEAANGAANVALADGVWREEALGFERAFYFFDASARDAARAAWRQVTAAAEAEPHYWKQVDGRWVEGP